MKHFTSRQMFLILALLFPLSRMILFPATLAFSSGTLGIFVALICMILELAVAVAVFVMWKKSELSFLDIMSNAFGKVGGKIVSLLYVLLFFVKLILLLSSQKLMMFNVLYENVSQYVLFLPVCVLLGYAGSKNSNSVARVFEISAWLVAIAFLGIMVLSASAVRVENFFPLEGGSLGGGVLGIVKSAYAYPLYFGDFTFFLMFFSETRKDFKADFKILFSWLVNFAVTMVFILVFFGVFGKLAVGGTYAISNLSKYTVAFSQIGRYDFLFILVVGFGFVLLALAIFHALLSAGEFASGKRWIWSISGAVLLYIAVYFTSGNYESTTAFLTRYFSPFAIIMQFVLPIFGCVFVCVKGGRNEKSNTAI